MPKSANGFDLFRGCANPVSSEAREPLTDPYVSETIGFFAPSLGLDLQSLQAKSEVYNSPFRKMDGKILDLPVAAKIGRAHRVLAIPVLMAYVGFAYALDSGFATGYGGSSDITCALLQVRILSQVSTEEQARKVPNREGPSLPLSHWNSAGDSAPITSFRTPSFQDGIEVWLLHAVSDLRGLKFNCEPEDNRRALSFEMTFSTFNGLERTGARIWFGGNE